MDAVAGIELSHGEHLNPALTKPAYFIQSGLWDRSLLVGSIHSSAPPTVSVYMFYLVSSQTDWWGLLFLRPQSWPLLTVRMEARSARKEKLGAGDQLCPLGKGAVLRWRWGRVGGRAGWPVGRWQSRAILGQGWSRVVNLFGGSGSAWVGVELRSGRTGRAKAEPSPRGVRQVIQGTSGTRHLRTA